MLITTPGCVRFYDRNVLKRIPPINPEQTSLLARNNVTLALHAMSPEESTDYFGRNLAAEGYFPFQLHLENHTNKEYIIEPSYISLVLASPKKVAKLIHYDTSMHMKYSSALAFLFAWTLIPFCIAPTGYTMHKINQKTTKYICRHSLSPNEKLKIPPYAHIDKFFFVQDSDFKTKFSINLCERKGERQLLRFPIDLNKRDLRLKEII